MSDEFIIVGKLGRTRGLDGEMYITPATDFPERFFELTSIFVRTQNEWESLPIEKVRMIGKRPAVKFKRINSPEDAASLTNRDIAVTKDQVVKLPDKMYYIFDLVGCVVKDKATDETIGTIVDVEQYPANDAYVIETPEKEKIRFPAVKQFVHSVDIENKLVLVDRAGLMT